MAFPPRLVLERLRFRRFVSLPLLLLLLRFVGGGGGVGGVASYRDDDARQTRDFFLKMWGTEPAEKRGSAKRRI